jgi:phage-related protein
VSLVRRTLPGIRHAVSEKTSGFIERAGSAHPVQDVLMIGIAIVALVIGLVLLFIGLFVEAAKFLLWVGLVIVILAIIAAILRYIRRKA